METQIDLIRSYDDAADQWRTKIERLGYAAAYRWLVAKTGLNTHGKTLLDAGCGTGDFARALIEVAGAPRCTTLLDPSANMVAAAQRSLMHLTHDIRPMVARLETAPQHNSDIVLCAHVIEHFDDPIVALRCLKARLAPEGRMLLIVSKPHWCNWIIWVRWRHKMIAPSRLKIHLAAVGLRCLWDAGFPAGPPNRSSHAYLITHV